MKIQAYLLFLFSGFLSAGLCPGAVNAGDQAPDFALKDLDGNVRKLSEQRGKIVVLEWNNPDCPFVKKHYENSGNLPKLQRQALDQGVVWWMINSGAHGKQGGDYSDEQLKAYLTKNKAAPSAYFTDHDGAVGRLFGAKTTPHIFVIGPEGKVVYAGAIDSIRSADATDVGKAEDYVKAVLDSLKRGAVVTKPSTEPYGCSVKY